MKDLKLNVKRAVELNETEGSLAARMHLYCLVVGTLGDIDPDEILEVFGRWDFETQIEMPERLAMFALLDGIEIAKRHPELTDTTWEVYSEFACALDIDDPRAKASLEKLRADRMEG